VSVCVSEGGSALLGLGLGRTAATGWGLGIQVARTISVPTQA